MKSALERKWQWMAWGTLLACFGGVQAAKADLLLTVQSVTGKAGDVNDLFNVYVTNLGTSPVDVAAFNFEIQTTSPDITFEQATTGTTLFRYVFAGNSLFGPVISTSPAGRTLDASDIAATPNSFTAVNPAGSFGLGEISFIVAPGAPPQIAPVDFNTNNAVTSISDQNGNSLSLQFSNGQITVTSVTAVPEPSSLTLLVSAGVALLIRKRRRRI